MQRGRCAIHIQWVDFSALEENNVFGGSSSAPVIVQSVKVVDKTEEQNEDGTLTIRGKERFANELTLAFTNGESQR